jgi:O-acetyl-ADP-ribose deacetylase (regulator of RNase III)
MEVKIFNGDITKCKADVIAHQVNCQFVMGGGVALAIRKKWPVVYNNYVEMGKQHKKPSNEWLGTCQIVKIDQNRYVANLFGQDDLGYSKCFTNYSALETALKELAWQVEYMGLKTIAFPWLMSCGLAGGDWNIVKPLIEKTFEDLDIEIQYWKY